MFATTGRSFWNHTGIFFRKRLRPGVSVKAKITWQKLIVDQKVVYLISRGLCPQVVHSDGFLKFRNCRYLSNFKYISPDEDTD